MTKQVQGIRGLFKKRDDVARAVLKNLASRGTGGETEVDAIVEATDIPRLEVVRVFKELEKRACGEFIVGRKGHVSRMRWLVDPQHLLGAATETLHELPTFERDPDADVQDARTPVAGQTDSRVLSDELLVHNFNLRPGLTVSFELPHSLTRVEAGRLARFILSLPFD